MAAGRLWLAGVALDWSKFHAGDVRRRVPLPTYPFNRQRFWLEPQAASFAPAAVPEGRRPANEWLYVPAWTLAPRPPAAAIGRERWLVFEDAAGVSAAVSAKARALGIQIVSVTAGGSFAGIVDDRCQIDPAEPGDYRRLLEALAQASFEPERVVHLWGLRDDGTERFEGQQTLGFFSLVRLLQAAGVASDGRANRSIELVVVTAGAHEVTGAERLRPGAATALAVCQVAPHEYPGVRCRSVDIEPGDGQESGQLLREILSRSADSAIAYRNGRRWAPSFARVEPGDTASARLRDRGVYLITGGVGGVGLELAFALVRGHNARVALVHRSALPAAVVERLIDLERAGGEVLLLQADVADEASMRQAIVRTLDRFGTIDGVVHAAGADKTAIPIQQLAPADCAAQFRPRVDGLVALDRALGDLALDFCVVHSSLASILGVVGHSAYTAAHLFMDAYVAARNRGALVRWTTVDWDNWTTWKSSAAAQAGSDLLMTAEEGWATYRSILALDEDLRHVVVSTGDLDARVRRWKRTSAQAGASDAPAKAASTHPRPALKTAYAAPRDERERTLCRVWEDTLGIHPVGVHDNFFELGGDSVIGIQIVSRAAAAGLRLNARLLFERQTVGELAAGVEMSVAPVGEALPSAGAVPLTPIQHWFFEQDLADPHHFNQAVLFELDRTIPMSALEHVAEELSAHHDALRLRFEHDASGRRQRVDADAAIAVHEVDLSSVALGAEREAIERTATGFQTSLDLAAGPLLQFVVMRLGPDRPGRLLLIGHHLIVDAISWRVLVEDLVLACEQIAAGRQVDLPPAGTPFHAWALGLDRYAASADFAAEAGYWTSMPSERVAPLPVDIRGGSNTVSSTARLTLALAPDETAALLQDASAALNAQADELLLTALQQTIGAWTGEPAVLVDVEGHGREPVVPGADVSRTVGWFTTIYPVVFEATAATVPVEALKSVKQAMRSVPLGGIGHGVLRYVARDGRWRDSLRQMPQPEISFLYLGRLDRADVPPSWIRPAREAVGATRSAKGRRQHLIDVQVAVTAGALETTWSFNESVHHRSTIDGLARGFCRALRGLTAAAQSVHQALTPSDFPAARVDQDDLDRLLSTMRDTEQV